MYTINNIKDINGHLTFIELSDSENSSLAKIHLNQGASLQLLSLNNHSVIKDLYPLSYSDTYASSILFPFVNRIKDGLYAFDGKEYQFETNQKQENNALHGLVYNKTFTVIDEKTTIDSASVTLQYDEVEESIGFPYTYAVQLEYTLLKEKLNLRVSIKNTDTKTFPFTLGWHPYFYSSNLYDSSLVFDSNKRMIFDERNITTGVEQVDRIDVFEVKDKQLDDCYVLDSNKIIFKTPDYNLTIRASSKENFLQMYTPPKANFIAIEPTTGVSDSFNNKIGLQVLNPGKSYELNWSVEIDK